MKMKARCIPCLLNRVIFEAELTDADYKKQEDIVKNAARIILDNYGKGKSSAQIATLVHKAAYDMLGNSDPYSKLKKRSNEIARKLLPEAERFIDESDDRLESAILCSIVGNSIDFGIEGSASSPEELEIIFGNELIKGLHHNDLKRAKKYMKGDVLYFTDNCGEVVFDKLVCRELKKQGASITLVVKGEPILTDATYDDVESLNFGDVVDDIMTTNSFAVGIDFDSITDELKHKLENTSLIICKGMANYEAFSEKPYKPIFYFLKAKCMSIAEDMNLPLGANAIKIYE
jgi:damage-control phosphatase, subfamily I